MSSEADRTTVRLTETVGEVVGADGRDYNLELGDVVTLPVDTAEPLVEKGAADELNDGMGDLDTDDEGGLEPDDIRLNGPPEPIVKGDRVIIAYPKEEGRGIGDVELGTWECKRCKSLINAGVDNGQLVEPACESCDRGGPFVHAGPDEITPEVQQAALRADSMWHPPGSISDEGFYELWDDVREYLYDHWDAGDDEAADTVYAGLTAYALSTWVRPELDFVPHIMLMGKTTGGKTRLLNTLSRVSYRAMVSASATPASMYRLIDAYRVSFYISEYHGLHHETRREVDAVVRAGQKRNEVVTRAEPTATGHEPMTFDPFTHISIATQFEPDDDIINRCIQVRSSTASRDMPATLDEDRARELRDRLLFARYRLLDSGEWEDAEKAAYRYLADRNITGRTREKLLGLLTIAHVWGKVDEFDPYVEEVAEQDREAAADSEDALVVEALRDLAFEEVATTSVFGDNDPFAAVEIPLTDVAERYEDMTGTEKSAAWVGHVRSRLDLDKARRRDGTVISDEDLGPKLQQLCQDLNLAWEALETHEIVEELDEDEKWQSDCSECGENRATHRHIEDGHHLCEECADAVEEFEG